MDSTCVSDQLLVHSRESRMLIECIRHVIGYQCMTKQLLLALASFGNAIHQRVNRFNTITICANVAINKKCLVNKTACDTDMLSNPAIVLDTYSIVYSCLIATWINCLRFFCF